MRPPRRQSGPGIVAVGTMPATCGRFRGRATELSDLRDRYQSGTETRRADGTAGPATLLVHGKAGVGKTALAIEFGRRVAQELGHSVVFADLGHPGGLGTAALFRELASSLRELMRSPHRLIILDSVTEPAELAALPPIGSLSTLLVVSRRVLAPALAPDSYVVEVLSTDDAWPMLADIAETNPLDQPESAAEILELCGRLPAAVASVGTQVAGSAERLRAMAIELRPLKSRLDRIGGSVARSIESEYGRLTPAERRAFLFLSLVDAPTFASWVLGPLLNVGVSEAEALADQLARAQMLESGDVDNEGSGHFGVGRHRLHPLFKAYAKQRLDREVSPTDIAEAKLRLAEACLELCARVLSALAPDMSARIEGLVQPKWIPADSGWLQGITFSVTDWLQAEYGNVACAIAMAYRNGWWDVCWRLGEYLGDSVPDGLSDGEILRTLDLSLAAAQHLDSAVGTIRMLLAQATVLTSLEQYEQAFAALESAELGCGQLEAPELAAVGRGLIAAAHSKRADAWLQLADYDKSFQESESALALARSAGDELQEDKAKSLLRELKVLRKKCADAPDAGASQSFWAGALAYGDRLLAAEVARRQRDSTAAELQLRQALRQNYGNARRAASVRYRLARLFLDQSYQESDETAREHLSLQAVGFSAGALNNFIYMNNQIGQLRARCLLARSLCSAGRIDRAKYQLELVQCGLDEVTKSQPTPFLLPITARFMRSQGDYYYYSQAYSDACVILDDALHLFGYLGDYWSYVSTLRLLGMAHRLDGSYAAANASFWQLAEIEGADSFGGNGARTELIKTARQMGHEATALDLEACIGGRSYGQVGRASWSLLKAMVRGHEHRACADTKAPGSL